MAWNRQTAKRRPLSSNKIKEADENELNCYSNMLALIGGECDALSMDNHSQIRYSKWKIIINFSFSRVHCLLHTISNVCVNVALRQCHQSHGNSWCLLQCSVIDRQTAASPITSSCRPHRERIDVLYWLYWMKRMFQIRAKKKGHGRMRRDETTLK